jgi:lysozyme
MLTPDQQEQALRLAAGLCRQFEGLKLRPYLCPAGVPTIGIGCTHYEDGRAVRMSDPPITRERADELLLGHLRTECLPAVLELCPGADTTGRIAALCSFVFNLGAQRLSGSTLRERVNHGEWDGARAELMRWTRCGNSVLPGLVERRRAEAALL